MEGLKETITNYSDDYLRAIERREEYSDNNEEDETDGNPFYWDDRLTDIKAEACCYIVYTLCQGDPAKVKAIKETLDKWDWNGIHEDIREAVTNRINEFISE